MLTLKKIYDALDHMKKAEEAEMKRQEQRLKDGLPSWDMVISGNQWSHYRDEGLKAGCILTAKDHYVVSIPMYPPSRVMLSWGAGEDITIPNPNSNESKVESIKP